MDLNQVTIIGRLTRDPELRYGQSGTAVCKFAVAVNHFPAKDGQENVSFFNVVCFGKTAENVNQYMSKGKQVAISGSLRQNRWEDNEGQKRSIVEINANQIQFIGSGQSQGEYNPTKREDMALQDSKRTVNIDDDDDVPF